MRSAILAVSAMRRVSMASKEEYSFDRSLVELITQAMESVGFDDASGEARALATELQSKLRIDTVPHLIQAFSTPSELEDLRALVKGRTLTALKASAAAAADAAIAAIPKAKVTKRELHLELRRIDLIKLSEIDHISRRFEARVFVQFAAVGAALDPALSSEVTEFPFDARGEPTFRPSCGWYLNQIDFHHTTRPIHSLDHKVQRSGDDLLLTKRIEGNFSAEFDLHKFPCDVQSLSFTIAFNCANEGMTPVVLSLSDGLDCDLERTGFTMASTWNLDPQLGVELTTVGSSPARRFPAIRIDFTVRRRPQFFLLNVTLPVSLLSLTGLVGFSIHPLMTPERLDYGVTLTLTLVAYKFAVGSTMPEVTYLTMLDKFELWCTFVVLLFVLESGVLGFVAHPDAMELSDEDMDEYPNIRTADRISHGSLFVLWTLGQLWFLWHLWSDLGIGAQRQKRKLSRRAAKSAHAGMQKASNYDCETRAASEASRWSSFKYLRRHSRPTSAPAPATTVQSVAIAESSAVA